MGLRQPPPLGMFLDYGGDVAGLPALALEGLAEAVVVHRRLNPPEQNATERAYFRSCVERWVKEGPTAVSPIGGVACVVTQATLSAFAWAADCYDDPCLAARLEQALPPDLFAALIEWATERQARAEST